MHLTVRRLVSLAVVGVVALGACSAPSSGSPAAGQSVTPGAPEVNPAGDIPDNQVFIVYADPSGAFSLKVPEGWASADAGGAVTFTDKLNAIRIESSSTPTPPTSASMTAELPAISSSTPGYVAGTVTDVTRSAGAGILATYEGDAAADPVTGKVVHDAFERYEFWHAGRLVVLTLSGPVGADNVDPWKIVSDSLTWSA
ncbi:hypothetical protein [Cellulomonas sp. ICMP 17802]|uniref:hypothetical protein n=1 Tax=Cellulomonas sp. ICMP 17802 TaxID=3239199 RepID=UPI00351AD587